MSGASFALTNGPTPSRNPRRRNARPAFRILPRTGIDGEPPGWPLDGTDVRELATWAALWRDSPQAHVWHELRMHRIVARYARLVVRAERKRSSATALSETRQLEDRLGLNPLAMRRMMWEIAPEEDTSDADGGPVDLDAFRGRVG